MDQSQSLFVYFCPFKPQFKSTLKRGCVLLEIQTQGRRMGDKDGSTELLQPPIHQSSFLAICL